ncbi:MAG: RagB/SusD family nutrient uptake outer membrane protein, partial [Prevotellaceae bacterium]|jgi:tetratricopeptide (TPR) repeat protein|nr:RagB/SusD family nutrient uptake outer membrane protein [Prevotellaceae bacterium]
VKPIATIPEEAQDWVSVSTMPATRALSYCAIVIIIQPNNETDRSTTITITSSDGSVTIEYNIEQKGFASSDEEAQKALDELYASLRYNIGSDFGGGGVGIFNYMTVLFNEMGDDMVAAGYDESDFPNVQQLNEFSYDATNDVIRYMYNSFTNVIYEANLVLERVTGDTPVQKRICAEARSLRAWAQFMLTIGWGTPPLFDGISPTFTKPGNYAGGHNGLLEWCAQEAEAAALDLDERQSTADEAGAAKVTKGFALTLAGKARLFMGDYEGAKTHLKQVIQSNKYALVPGDRWANLFHVSGDLNEEKIFEVDLVYDPSLEFWGHIQTSRWQFNYFWNWRIDKFASQPTFDAFYGWGSYPGIRKDFAEEMLANDGDSPRRKATFLTPEEFLYEMEWNGGKKDDGTYLTREELEVSDGIGISYGGGLYGMEGYFAKKTISWHEDMQESNLGFQNYTIFRYAEVLLMYAEACAQTGDSDGLQYLQAIQHRAGSAHVSQTLTLDDVKREKKYEMWIEGVRWFDMVRWGDTDGVVNNGKSKPTTYDAFFTKGEAKHRIYVEYHDPNRENPNPSGFVKGKHEYLPFPESVMMTNPNLVQNPSGR